MPPPASPALRCFGRLVPPPLTKRLEDAPKWQRVQGVVYARAHGQLALWDRSSQSYAIALYDDETRRLRPLANEQAANHCSFLDRRVVAFLEVAQQPACRDARVPARLLSRDQHRQVKRVSEAERR
jgi:hypothetical protein